MIFITKQNIFTILRKTISLLVLITFLTSSVIPPNASAQIQTASSLSLPKVGEFINPTPAFNPPVLKGIVVEPEKPFSFDFILDKGDFIDHRSSIIDHRDLDEELKKESEKLIKYFLTSLTIPEDELWVNLSPYEKNRIIPDKFGVTEMGRDLLAQDYILKQLTSSLMYPEDDLGKEFWDKVYKQAQEQYGTTDIPVNTFNKVWIVPDKAVVYENGNRAFVVESRLKVMLEADYLAAQNSGTRYEVRGTYEDKARNTYHVSRLSEAKDPRGVTTNIIKSVIIPALEKEVNTGEHFAKLRQIYNSLILATWYKKNLKESLLNLKYSDQKKTNGVEIEDKNEKQKIYEQYLESFKKGVYNYIKEDYDPVKQEIVPRKYFSGGVKFKVPLQETTDQAMLVSSKGNSLLDIKGIYFDYDTAKIQEPERVTAPPIPSEAYNALSMQGLDSLIEDFMSESATKKNEILKGRNVFAKFLQRLGSEIEAKGPVVYYPFGGVDAFTSFNLVKDATDVISVGMEPFGRLKDIAKAFNPKDYKAIFNGVIKYQGFDPNNFLIFMEKHMALGGIGLLRIPMLLDGKIKGIYYFSIGFNGNLNFYDESEMKDENVEKNNAVIEFFDPKDKKIKRFWYMQSNIYDPNPFFSDFIKKAAFKTLLIKAPTDEMFDELFAKKWIFGNGLRSRIKYNYDQNIFLPAKNNNAVVISDQFTYKKNMPHPIWKKGHTPKTIQLKQGEQFGYSTEGGYVYYDNAGNLIDLAMTSEFIDSPSSVGQEENQLTSNDERLTIKQDSAMTTNMPKTWIHATDLDKFIDILVSGHLKPISNDGTRLYVNPEYADHPGYFGGIWLLISNKQLKEANNEPKNIQGKIYYEITEPVPLENFITDIRYSGVYKDSLLILDIDRRFEQLLKEGKFNKDQSEHFYKNRKWLMSLINTDEEQIALLKRKLRVNFNNQRLDDDTYYKVFGLSARIMGKNVKRLVREGKIIYYKRSLYVSKNISDEYKNFDLAEDSINMNQKYSRFNNELAYFCNLNPKRFKQNFTSWLISEKGSVSLQDAKEIDVFSKLIEEKSTDFNLEGLKRENSLDEDYPFIAYESAIGAKKIIEKTILPVKFVIAYNEKSNIKEEYYFNEVTVAGMPLIVDLTADQFEEDPDSSYKFLKTGITAIPKKLLEETRYRDRVPQYVAWNRIDSAMLMRSELKNLVTVAGKYVSPNYDDSQPFILNKERSIDEVLSYYDKEGDDDTRLIGFDKIYDPTRAMILKQLFINDLKYKQGMSFLDLGSGDGRVVVLAALLGLDALGIEVDTKLFKTSIELVEMFIEQLEKKYGAQIFKKVEESGYKWIRTDGKPGSIEFKKTDFFNKKIQFRSFDILYRYFTASGISGEKKLFEKISKKMNPGSQFVEVGVRPEIGKLKNHFTFVKENPYFYRIYEKDSAMLEDFQANLIEIKEKYQNADMPSVLEIPPDAYNAFAMQGLDVLIEKFMTENVAKKDEITRERDEFAEFLKQLGQEIGAKGPVVYYPFGGVDAFTSFNLVKDATDVISMGIQAFGNIHDIVKVFNSKYQKSILAGSMQYKGFDSNPSLNFMETHMALGGLGLLRIPMLLDGKIEGVYYFDVDLDRNMKFVDEKTFQGGDFHSRNAVIEFYDSKERKKKRFWYFQSDILDFDPCFHKFINNTKFQTLMIKAPSSEMFGELSDRSRSAQQAAHQYNQNIFNPARNNNAIVIHDQSEPKEKNPQPIWRNGYVPETIPLKAGQEYGYSTEGGDVYYGEAKDLIDFSTTSDSAMVSGQMRQDVYDALTDLPVATIINLKNNRKALIGPIQITETGEKIFKIYYSGKVFEVDFKTGEVDFGKKDKPRGYQGIYIQKESFDIEKGLLTINIDGELVEININDPMIIGTFDNREHLYTYPYYYPQTHDFKIKLKTKSGDKTTHYIMSGNFSKWKSFPQLSVSGVNIASDNLGPIRFNFRGMNILTQVLTAVRIASKDKLSIKIGMVNNTELRKEIENAWFLLKEDDQWKDLLGDVKPLRQDVVNRINLKDVRRKLSKEKYQEFQDIMNEALRRSPYGKAFVKAGYYVNFDFNKMSSIGLDDMVIVAKAKENQKDEAMLTKPKNVRIAPSILDVSPEEIVELFKKFWRAGGKIVHIDHMDGKFVPVEHDNLWATETLRKIIDQGYLGVIVENLVRNSVKAKNGDDIFIDVAFREVEGYLTILIQDNGKGGAPKDLWEKARVGATSSENGTGIGLPLINYLVEDLGGTLKVVSPEDEGTVVTVKIPIENRKRDSALIGKRPEGIYLANEHEQINRDWPSYLKKEGLDKYKNLCRLFDEDTDEMWRIKAWLLTNPYWRPVFMQVLPNSEKEKIEIWDKDLVEEAGGETVLIDHKSFSVGFSESKLKAADERAQQYYEQKGKISEEELIEDGKKVIVAIADKEAPSDERMIDGYKVAHGRRVFFPLKNKWLSLKGAGQLKEKGELPYFFNPRNNTWNGLVEPFEIKDIFDLVKREEKDDYEYDLVKYISTAAHVAVLRLPKLDGILSSIQDGTHKLDKSVIVFDIVDHPDRLVNLPQILKDDPKLEKLCWLLSNKEGRIIKPSDLMKNILNKMALMSAELFNESWFAWSLHVQDIEIASGNYSDTIELHPLDYYEERRFGIQQLRLDNLNENIEVFAKVLKHSGAARRQLFPSVKGYFKEFLKAYFETLDKDGIVFWHTLLTNSEEYHLSEIINALKSDYDVLKFFEFKGPLENKERKLRELITSLINERFDKYFAPSSNPSYVEAISKNSDSVRSIDSAAPDLAMLSHKLSGDQVKMLENIPLREFIKNRDADSVSKKGKIETALDKYAQLEGVKVVTFDEFKGDFGSLMKFLEQKHSEGTINDEDVVLMKFINDSYPKKITETIFADRYKRVIPFLTDMIKTGSAYNVWDAFAFYIEFEISQEKGFAIKLFKADIPLTGPNNGLGTEAVLNILDILTKIIPGKLVSLFQVISFVLAEKYLKYFEAVEFEEVFEDKGFSPIDTQGKTVFDQKIKEINKKANGDYQEKLNLFKGLLRERILGVDLVALVPQANAYRFNDNAMVTLSKEQIDVAIKRWDEFEHTLGVLKAAARMISEKFIEENEEYDGKVLWKIMKKIEVWHKVSSRINVKVFDSYKSEQVQQLLRERYQNLSVILDEIEPVLSSVTSWFWTDFAKYKEENQKLVGFDKEGNLVDSGFPLYKATFYDLQDMFVKMASDIQLIELRASKVQQSDIIFPNDFFNLQEIVEGFLMKKDAYNKVYHYLNNPGSLNSEEESDNVEGYGMGKNIFELFLIPYLQVSNAMKNVSGDEDRGKTYVDINGIDVTQKQLDVIKENWSDIDNSFNVLKQGGKEIIDYLKTDIKGKSLWELLEELEAWENEAKKIIENIQKIQEGRTTDEVDHMLKERAENLRYILKEVNERSHGVVFEQFKYQNTLKRMNEEGRLKAIHPKGDLTNKELIVEMMTENLEDGLKEIFEDIFKVSFFIEKFFAEEEKQENKKNIDLNIFKTIISQSFLFKRFSKERNIFSKIHNYKQILKYIDDPFSIDLNKGVIYDGKKDEPAMIYNYYLRPYVIFAKALGKDQAMTAAKIFKGYLSEEEIKSPEIQSMIKALSRHFKFIASDLDDTILNGKDPILKEVAAQFITDLIKKGSMFVPVTAKDLKRTLANYSDRLSKEARANQYLITENGARISQFDENGELRKDPVRVIPLSSDENISNKVHQLMKDSWNKAKASNPELPEKMPLERIKDDSGQTLIMKFYYPGIDQEIKKAIADEIRKKLSEDADFEGINVLESSVAINITRANKGEAVRFVLDKLGINEEDSLVMGDSEVDDSMYKALEKAIRVYFGKEPYPGMPEDLLHFPVFGYKGGEAVLRLIDNYQAIQKEAKELMQNELKSQYINLLGWKPDDPILKIHLDMLDYIYDNDLVDEDEKILMKKWTNAVKKLFDHPVFGTQLQFNKAFGQRFITEQVEREMLSAAQVKSKKGKVKRKDEAQVASDKLQVENDIQPFDFAQGRHTIYDIQGEKGGIDLNPKKMNLETKGNGSEITWPEDPAEIEKIEINGLVPVIFSITPVTNLHMLLGLNVDEREYQASSKEQGAWKDNNSQAPSTMPHAETDKHGFGREFSHTNSLEPADKRS